MDSRGVFTTISNIYDKDFTNLYHGLRSLINFAKSAIIDV